MIPQEKKEIAGSHYMPRIHQTQAKPTAVDVNQAIQGDEQVLL